MLLMSAGTSVAHPYLGNGKTPELKRDYFLQKKKKEEDKKRKRKRGRQRSLTRLEGRIGFL